MGFFRYYKAKQGPGIGAPLLDHCRAGTRSGLDLDINGSVFILGGGGRLEEDAAYVPPPKRVQPFACAVFLLRHVISWARGRIVTCNARYL